MRGLTRSLWADARASIASPSPVSKAEEKAFLKASGESLRGAAAADWKRTTKKRMKRRVFLFTGGLPCAYNVTNQAVWEQAVSFPLAGYCY